VELGIFAHPRVTVIDVHSMDIFVGYRGQDIKPLLQKLCAEPIIRTGVRKIDDHLEGRVAEWFQSEYDVVYK